jgi:hypothetical protein
MRVLAAEDVCEEHLTFDGMAMFSADLQLELADGVGWFNLDLKKWGSKLAQEETERGNVATTNYKVRMTCSAYSYLH